MLNWCDEISHCKGVIYLFCSHDTTAGLLQIEYEHETCYAKPKNGLTFSGHFWTQYNTFHTHTQFAGVQPTSAYYKNDTTLR